MTDPSARPSTDIAALREAATAIDVGALRKLAAAVTDVNIDSALRLRNLSTAAGEFLAAAWFEVPALLDEVERLRAQREGWQGCCDENQRLTADLTAARTALSRVEKLADDIQAAGRQRLADHLGSDIGRAQHDALYDAAQRIRAALNSEGN